VEWLLDGPTRTIETDGIIASNLRQRVVVEIRRLQAKFYCILFA
jgi:hypothetical protein